MTAKRTTLWGDHEPTISEKKVQILSSMVAGLNATVEPDLVYLGKAKALLDGGAWWKRARDYGRKIDRAGNDLDGYVVSAEEFQEMVDGYKAGILKGCQRVKVILERKTKREGR